jgi:positive phototaxis protein PixI
MAFELPEALPLEQFNFSAERTTSTGQQFLRFRLLPDTTALLPVNQLAEILTVPIGQIIPIPHMPASVLGVYNWRGEILWIIDLGYLIGLPPLHQQARNASTYTAVVVHENHATSGRQRTRSQNRKTLGLVVHHVEDMEWYNPDLIQSPPASVVDPSLAPFLRGHLLNDRAEISLVLEGEAIVQGFSN